MLVACRLADLSALKAHYAGVNGHAQRGAIAISGHGEKAGQSPPFMGLGAQRQSGLSGGSRPLRRYEIRAGSAPLAGGLACGRSLTTRPFVSVSDLERTGV
jgi:hypothetical protein